MARKRGLIIDARASLPESSTRLSAREPIDRRAFVATTGGILVSAGAFAACSGDPSTLGTVKVTITGLPGGLANAGTAIVTRTDISGQDPLNLEVPAVGTGQADVPAGTYHVIYTPPAGYQVNGNNEFDVEIRAQETTEVNITVQAVAAQQGTIHIVVTGMGGSAVNAGSAVIHRTDQAASDINVPIPLAGIANTVVGVGTYSVTYTPPANHTVNNGVTNPQTVVVTNGATLNATFAITASGGGTFQTPDLVNNASFEDGSGSFPSANGWDNFNNGGSGAPSGVSRDTSKAFAGTTSVKKILATGPETGGAFHYPFYFPFAPYPGVTKDRVWTRFYFYIDAVFDGILKLQLYNDDAGHDFGGLFLNGGSIAWVASEWLYASGTIYNIIPLSTVLNAWHSLEVDFWRNGDPSGWASAAFYLDDQLVTHADGPIAASGTANGYWAANRIQTGKRDVANTGSHGVGDIYWYGIKNAGSTVLTNIWADRVAISSLGRIGP